MELFQKIRLFFCLTGSLSIGALGYWFNNSTFSPYVGWCFAIAAFLAANEILKTTYYKSGTPLKEESTEPHRLKLKCTDYFKALICWANAFKRTYVIDPGLYFTGEEYDSKSPLLVTSNYHLTVFLLLRNLFKRNVRLLVVDTDGINVWCAAGKGTFSNSGILKQLERYDRETITQSNKISLILPKFGFSGIDLRSIKEEGIRPIIGPLYARDISKYLSKPPLKDRGDEKVNFSLQSRLFSWLPGLIQFFGYSVLLAGVLLVFEHFTGIKAPVGLIGLIALLATLYPVFFPWIPGERFAVKGVWMASLVSVGYIALADLQMTSLAELCMPVLFIFATAIFFGLSYTGNSAVSNYSRVRKEIATFLPLDIILYMGSLATFIIAGVRR